MVSIFPSNLSILKQPASPSLQPTVPTLPYLSLSLSLMEKHRYGIVVISSIVICLGLVSFVSCIAAEIKRTKTKDLKLDGKLCYVPGNQHTFAFGIVAMVCLVAGQIIGNLVICTRKKKCFAGDKNQTISTVLLVISWISFGSAVILISAATSMNKRQPYGKGWLDSKCYIPKDWVYIAAAVLVLVTIASLLGSAIITIRKNNYNEKGWKLHEQSI